MGSTSKGQFLIHLATADHIEALQAIELSAGRLFAEIGMDSIANDPPPQASELQRHIDNETLWVAVDTDTPDLVLGYAAASVVDDEGHLDQVSVGFEAQGRGIGVALVEMVCEWARHQGHDAVTLTTFADVPWNGPYYQRLQFEAMDGDDMGPELLAIRQREISNGIDVAPRVAMRRLVSGT